MKTDSEGAGEVEHGDKIITGCSECGFVYADRVEDYDSVSGSQADPGRRHYEETGHSCGTFEPTEGSALEDVWAVVYGISEGEIPDGEKVLELATEIQA